MSGNPGPLASTKGESTSSKAGKQIYESLDVNKYFKTKAQEPSAKQVHPQYGMQALGKAIPGRRTGLGAVGKSDSASPNDANLSSISQTTSATSIGPAPQQIPPGWSNAPPQATVSQSPLSVPNAPIHRHQPANEKTWSGRPEKDYASQRFAQEFPSLDGGGLPKNQPPNANAPPASQGKHGDNQYGPGPVLRPQTEGSWTQGGARGMRPPGPGSGPPNAQNRDFGPDRPNLGGPTPPPMSLGQGGPAPPPLGVYPMQYRGMGPPYMYPPNSGPPGPGPPGPGGFFPQGGMPRYGMPIPPGAPPPPSSHPEGMREGGRGGRGPPQPMRPSAQFAANPIIKQEDLKRMDEISTQDGGWASTHDDVDYNKKINFSDEDDRENQTHSSRSERKEQDRKEEVRPAKILQRQTSNTDKDKIDVRDREGRIERGDRAFECEGEEDWKKRGNAPFDPKDRDRGNRRGRDDDWRSNNNRFDDERNKKPATAPPGRMDSRSASEFGANKYPTNIPPRFQRQQQQPPINYSQSAGQRQTPSPVSSGPTGKEKDRSRDIQPYKLMERRRGDSDSSKDSGREKRYSAENESKYHEKESDQPSKSSRGPSDEVKISDVNKPLDSKDIRKLDDGKPFLRNKTEFTSSWADEVDDDELHREAEDHALRKANRDMMQRRDGQAKPDGGNRDGSYGPKRVYLLQRKVEDMRKPDVPQPKQNSETAKPEKPTEKSKPWGDRERDKPTESENLKENTEQPPVLAEHKEAPKVVEKEAEHPKVQPDKPSDPTHQQERKSHEREPRERKESEKYDRHDRKQMDRGPKHQQDFRHDNRQFDRDRHDRNRDHRQGGDRFSNRDRDHDRYMERDRGHQDHSRDKQKSRMWDSYDKRDGRTPEREYQPPAARGLDSLHTPNVVPTDYKSSQLDKEKQSDQQKFKDISAAEKLNKAQDKPATTVKESKEVMDSKGSKETLDRIDNKTKDFDKPKDSFDRVEDFDPDRNRDRDRDGRSQRNRQTRNERGVYQPRGSTSYWGSDPSRTKSRGINKPRGGGPYDKGLKGDKENEKDVIKEDTSGEFEHFRDHKSDKAESIDGNKRASSSEDVNLKKDKDMFDSKKASKSPASNKRNVPRNRLQGYGPPSDKNPFTLPTPKEEEKPSDQHTSKPIVPPPTGAPIPLMDLGEISPPNLPHRRGHHGGYQGGRGGRDIRPVPPRMRDDYQQFRGNGGKRGRGDAKPLMSLNSNDIDTKEWETESESEEDAKRNGHSAGFKSKGERDSKFSQNRNISKPFVGSEPNSSSTNQDTSNNNRARGAVQGRHGSQSGDNEMYSRQDLHGNADMSLSAEGDGVVVGFQEVRNKKNFVGKEKTFPPKGPRAEKPVKQTRIKNPPYEAHGSNKDIPPRFLAKGTQQPAGSLAPGAKSGDGNTFSKDSASLQGNSGWSTKPADRPAQTSQVLSQSVSAADSNKDSMEMKLSSTTLPLSTPSTKPLHGLDGTTAPVQTIIFENTNYKTGGKFPDTKQNVSKLPKEPSGLGSTLDMGKDLSISFGKTDTSTPILDFGTSAFDEPQPATQMQSQPLSSHAPTKPMSLAQTTRSTFSSHQPSPISPLAADLTEKVQSQSVKRLWDAPSMPSVAETSICEESTYSNFGSESFKTSDVSNRDFGRSSALPQSSNAYVSATPSSSTLSAISKPETSSTSNTSGIRQVKPTAPGMDPQSHSTMSSSPFASYTMPQQHQGSTAFGGLSAVPSPPTVMYGASQTMHAGGPPTGVYQTFSGPPIDTQVLSSSSRSQYSYPSAPSSAGPYGSLFMTSMESQPYQSLSYPHQHQHQHQHQQSSHTQSGSNAQAPTQTSRISPGPIMTTSGSGNQGVMISSTTSSLMNMKSQGGTGSHQSHPNMPPHVHPGAQQSYSQLSHHPHGAHGAQMSHPQSHMAPIGPVKSGYTQGAMATQSHSQAPLYISFDPSLSNQLNLNQNYMSSGIRSGPAGGPSASQSVQGLQPSSNYYSGNAGNQTGVYQTGSSQGGNMQQLHVVPGPQALQNLQSGAHFGIPFQSQLTMPGYSTQAAATVNALNLGSQLVRPGHSYMNTGVDLNQPSMKSSHDSLMNQGGWNTNQFGLAPGFHGGSKAGSNIDRNNGNMSMGNPRKGGSHMNSMGGGNMKYMPNPGYPGQKSGRGYTGPGPIQRPISTSPSTGPGGIPTVSSHSLPPSVSTTPLGVGGVNVGGGGGKPKPPMNDTMGEFVSM